MPYEKLGKNEPVCIADEVPFEIPDTWEWVRLGSIGETNIGLTYKPSDKVDESKGIAVLRSNNIQKGKMDYSDLVYISCSVPERAMINKGDILICARNGSRALVGKSAIVDTDGMAFGAFMAKYTSLFSGLLNQYILTFIESPVFRSQLDGVKTETINQITQDMLKEQLIPIPPLKEQHRINKKLKEIMPLVEKYGVAYFETTKLNDEFPELLKKSILQEAVQGKLIPQDENDEPASVLLDRIRAEKQALIKAGKIKKDKNESVIFRRDNSHYEKRGSEVVCIDDEIPFEIPNSWEWVRLKSICTKLVDGDHNPPKGETFETQYIMASSTNINNNRLVELNKVRYLSKEVFEQENLRTNATTGDLFFTSVGSLGRSCVYEGGYNVCFQRSVSVITTLIYNYYLKLVFDSAYFQNKVIKEATGTAQKGFYLNQLAETLIPVPPMSEQQRIVDFINKVLSTIEAL